MLMEVLEAYTARVLDKVKQKRPASLVNDERPMSDVQALHVMTAPDQRKALEHRDPFGYTPLHYAAYIGSAAHALTILHHANASGTAKNLLESQVTGKHVHRGMTPEQVAYTRQNCAVANALGSTKPCPTNDTAADRNFSSTNNGADTTAEDDDDPWGNEPDLPSMSVDADGEQWVTIDPTKQQRDAAGFLDADALRRNSDGGPPPPPRAEL